MIGDDDDEGYLFDMFLVQQLTSLVENLRNFQGKVTKKEWLDGSVKKE